MVSALFPTSNLEVKLWKKRVLVSPNRALLKLPCCCAFNSALFPFLCSSKARLKFLLNRSIHHIGDNASTFSLTRIFVKHNICLDTATKLTAKLQVHLLNQLVHRNTSVEIISQNSFGAEDSQTVPMA